MKMLKTVYVLSVGCMKYGQSLKLQDLVKNKVIKKELPDTIIIMEHDPVYTVGIRQNEYGENEEKKLKLLGAEFFRTNRGGLITFHGPGQMVVYPIINLKNFKPSVRWYVHNLENTIIQLCALFNIQASTSIHTGVWIKDNKVCAIGIHAGQYVTTHGLALNCNIDLQWFSHIVPCGIEGKSVTSLSEQLQKNIMISDVIPLFLNCFSTLFKCNITYYSTELKKKILEEIKN